MFGTCFRQRSGRLKTAVKGSISSLHDVFAMTKSYIESLESRECRRAIAVMTVVVVSAIALLALSSSG